MTRDPLAALNQFVGARVPGGCPDCDAVQTVHRDGPGVWRIVVAHDDSCTTYRRLTGRDA